MRFIDLPNINDLAPVVVTPTRYGGELEGWEWICIPYCSDHPAVVLPDAFADQPEAAIWWAEETNLRYFGLGDTPTDAMADMLGKWYPGSLDIAFDEAEELTDEECHEVFTDARRDAMLLLTSFISDSQNDDEYQQSSDLVNEMSDKWDEVGTSTPILTMLTAFAAELAAMAAEASDTPVEQIIQEFALNLEVHNGGFDAGT